MPGEVYEGDLLEAAVLAALLQGVNTFSGLARLINVDEKSLAEVLERLEARGLVKLERKGLIFKKLVVKLTKEGFREAEKAVERLKRLAEELKSLAGEAREKAGAEEAAEGERVRGMLAAYEPILPLLAWMGLIDLALLYPLTAAAAMAAADYYEEVEEPGAEEAEVDVDDYDFEV